MAENTKIQWTDHTWNIAVGCKKVDADCKFCYMYRGSLKETRYNPKEVRKTLRNTFNMPLRIKEPSKIFVSSLTDVFIEEIDTFRSEMWDIIRKCPQHTFQILTKRPERIGKCLPPDWGFGWPNVWIGTSIGSQSGHYRIDELINQKLHFNLRTLFLSIEPLYAPVEIHYSKLNSLDWVIVGGESGNETGHYTYRPCKISWIEKIVKDCQEYEIPVFVKQLGTHLSKELGLKDRHGGDITEFPKNLQIRQIPSNE